MAFKLKNVFSKNNINLFVGIISFLIFIWLIMYAVPGLFVSLFDTVLGKIILLGIVMLCVIYKRNLGIGMGILFIILYQFSHMVK